MRGRIEVLNELKRTNQHKKREKLPFININVSRIKTTLRRNIFVVKKSFCFCVHV